MSEKLRQALVALYDMWWNETSTYEGPAGYVLLPIDDDRKLNEQCEMIEGLMLDEGFH